MSTPRIIRTSVARLAMALAAVAAIACVPSVAHARAGGGVSVGRAAVSVARAPSISRPSFAAPSPARMTAPPPMPRYSQPMPRTESTGTGKSFIAGLAGGAIGAAAVNAMSPRTDVVVTPGPGAAAAPVIAGGAAPVIAGPAAMAPTIIERPLIGAGGILLLLAAAGGAAYWWMRHRTSRPGPVEPVDTMAIDADPVHLFYEVQQASMDSSAWRLSRYCSMGLTMLLTGSPEPGRCARTTLNSLTWSRGVDGAGQDTITYRFHDTVAGEWVAETWVFDSLGQVDGIDSTTII